jgi:hypothetical protein
VHRRIPWTAGATVLLALLAFLIRPATPARQVAARFIGYRMSTNGYRVAQFTVTNANEFPVRCRFWLTPPDATESRSRAMFDPEYEVIAPRSTFRLEGAARSRFPLLPPYPRGTNLPAAEWGLRINVWDARPLEQASPVRHRLSRFLIDAGLDGLGLYISRSRASVAVSDPISAESQRME